MLTQEEARLLLDKAKEATRKEILNWKNHSRHDELVVEVENFDSQFFLTFTRNPFEIKAHFRTKGKGINLARIDTQRQHINPDGARILGPHLHLYREGFVHLEWAESIDWYDADKPMATLMQFLDIIHISFPYGVQEDLI